MGTREADRLLAQVAADPSGQVAASPYETGRVVALAPWLPGHHARLEYLRRAQHPDGTWGGPAGYALVPTLSVTAALAGTGHTGAGPDPWLPAARAGVRALRRLLDPAAGPVVPDTLASELVLPALVAELSTVCQRWGDPRLPLPGGFHPRALERVRSGFAAGLLPPALSHSLEILAPHAAATPLVRPTGGAVGISPAATAAWLGRPDGDREAYEWLDRLQARGGGPVPMVAPIPYFEAAWVLNDLAVGGPVTAPAVLLDRLEAGLTEQGAPAGPGLPPDADDTAAVLVALLDHGRPRPPESLLGFYADGYFRCYHGERNPSLTANARALEAVAGYLAARPAARRRYGPAADATCRWVLAAQHPDGSWWDKWHASPYYATATAVRALAGHGGPGTAVAIARAVAWVRDSEYTGGGWGRWRATAEETAYALRVLGHGRRDPATLAAIGRAADFLAPTPTEEPPLWHGKELYAPLRVMRAARIGARMLAARILGRPHRLPEPRRSPEIGTPVQADRLS